MLRYTLFRSVCHLVVFASIDHILRTFGVNLTGPASKKSASSVIGEDSDPVMGFALKKWRPLTLLDRVFEKGLFLVTKKGNLDAVHCYSFEL